jgi:hypothetical protein
MLFDDDSDEKQYALRNNEHVQEKFQEKAKNGAL